MPRDEEKCLRRDLTVGGRLIVSDVTGSDESDYDKQARTDGQPVDRRP